MKRALAIGIDHYPTVGDLDGCVADAEAIAGVLRVHADGSPNFRVEELTSASSQDSISRARLREALESLFRNAQDTDLFMFFAGHGGQTPWGAELVTQDATPSSMGVSMNDLITLANACPARSVTLVLDCCFSGDVGNLAGIQGAAVAEPFRLGTAVLRENVTILAASRSTQASDESEGHGAFTRVLMDGLAGGATDHLGNITALSLFGYVSPAFDAWQQRPVIKTHMTEPLVLRVGPPWLESSLLRDLPHHFSTVDARVRLSPAHEGEGRPLSPEDPGTLEQQQFDYLGRLRNANLVTTDEGRAHYWVAMEGGDVYLTSLGRYFWRLATRRVL